MGPPLLLFHAGPLLCALPLDEVGETMRPLPVTPLAGLPPHVAGVAVVRGRPTPVVDVAAALGADAGDWARFVAVRGGPALATGPVLGVHAGSEIDLTAGAHAVPGGAPDRPGVRAVGVFRSRTLVLLAGAAMAPAAAMLPAPGSAGAPAAPVGPR